MRTVLVATGVEPGLSAVTADTPAPLLPLLGKPFIQHGVEVLVGQGCRQLDIVLHEHPDQIEALFGDGTRWGASFTYHVCRSGSDIHEKLALLARQDGEGLKLVFGDCLAAEGYAELLDCPPPAPDAPVRLAGHRADGVLEPVWAVVPAGWFSQTAASGAAMAERLLEAACSRGGVIELAAPLRWRTCADLLASSRRALDGEGPALLVTGRVTDANV